jgi:hypothetical protein
LATILFIVPSGKERNMKILMHVIVVIAVLSFIVAAWLKKSSLASKGKQAKTVEEKLALLEECGVKPAPPFTIDDLLKSFDREQFEEDGFNLILVGLGMNEGEDELAGNYCVNLWHFDTECIENHGDYKRIANRMMQMTQGSLLLENIKDYVDVEKKMAWLSFSFKGQTIKIDCEAQDDWVDPNIFGKFVDLLRQSDQSKVYIYYNLGGQDCILGCVTRDELKRLNDYGIKFEALR